MIVTELDSANLAAWDDYVRRSPNGLPYHLSGWREVLTRTYGYDTPYLLARDGEQIAGVMPLYTVRSWLVGSSVTTMQGGLCADTPEAAAALIERGREVAERAGVKRLVLQDTRQAWPGDLQTESYHVDWVVPVSSDADAVWKAVHRDARRQVRRGQEKGLTVQVDRTGRLAGSFYGVMSRFTHQAGTPIFGRAFLDSVLEQFAGQYVLYAVCEDGQTIGAYFAFVLEGTVYGTWGATLREYLDRNASYLAYWTMLEDAVRQGYTRVDLGRSPVDSNASRFKSQWGGTSEPVYQQTAYFGDGRATSAIAGRVRSDAGFRRFTQLWPRLPFAVHQWLGPHLRRHVPFA